MWLVDDITELMPDTMQRMIADSHYNEFLKDQKDMSYRDWSIEKRLVEAGGLGKKVYIHVGRGQGKTFTLLRHIEELEAKGKEVCIVDYRDSAVRTRPLNIEKIREAVIDWDLMSNRERDWCKPLYDVSFTWETKREKEHKTRQELCAIPWEYLDRNLFKRQYLGRWYFPEEVNYDDARNEERN